MISPCEHSPKIYPGGSVVIKSVCSLFGYDSGKCNVIQRQLRNTNQKVRIKHRQILYRSMIDSEFTFLKGANFKIHARVLHHKAPHLFPQDMIATPLHGVGCISSKSIITATSCAVLVVIRSVTRHLADRTALTPKAATTV